MRVPVELLSPDDFEKFANKIVEIKFNTEIISFGEGPDGGIDGMDDSSNPSIIVQSKRYHSSTRPKALVNTIKKEIEKLDKTISDNNFSEDLDYIIVTSVPLNPQARKNIRDIRPELIKSEDHILDANDLDSLSYKDEYKEIFKSYHLIDKELSDVLRNLELSNIELESKSFFDNFEMEFIVETDAIRKAYDYLLNKHVVFLVGQPGIGKTTSSQYLGLLFASHQNKNIKVIKRSVNDIDDVIKEYSRLYRNTNDTLFVIFDDFLGRNKFDKQDSALCKVRELVSLLKREENLYIVFNSRIQILKQATEENLEFGIFFEDIEEKVTVDISEVSKRDKAKILRKTFEKTYSIEKPSIQQIISDNYKQLRKDNKYLNIVAHSNYIPRSIEFLVRESRKEHQNFYEIVIKILNNPERIYQEIFTKLSKDSRMLLYCMAVFSSFPIPFKEVEIAFDKLQEEIEPFETLVSKLRGSWINTYYIIDEQEEIKYIDFINPSIFDYINKLLSKNGLVRRKISEKIPFLSPLQKLDDKRFLEQISNYDTFNQYEDKDKFIGNLLSAMIDKDELSEEEIRLLSDSIEKFTGTYFEYDNKHKLIQKGWLEIIKAIALSRNDKVKCLFLEILLYGTDNDKFIQQIVHILSLTEIGEVLETIDGIMLELDGVGLMQNELIDFAEEKTQVNVIQEFTKIIEERIIDDVVDTWDISYYVDEYLNENSEDIADYVGEYYDSDNNYGIVRLVYKLFEYYLEKVVFNIIPESFCEYLDTENIFDEIEPTLYEEISDRIPNYESSSHGDDDDSMPPYWTHRGEEPDYDLEIDDILDRDLDE